MPSSLYLKVKTKIQKGKRKIKINCSLSFLRREIGRAVGAEQCSVPTNTES
jgi:hypothetical protein